MSKRAFLLAAFLAVPFAGDYLCPGSFAQERSVAVQLRFSSRLRVNDSDYTGEAKVKTVIVDDSQNTLWSNDSSSQAGSEPASSNEIDVNLGSFSIELGSDKMSALPASVFDGSGPVYLLLWLDAGYGFERFQRIPISTTGRAANAYRLGGVAAQNYLTRDSMISIGNGNFTEKISSTNLQAFSSNGNVFTVGGGDPSAHQSIIADRGLEANPAMRYNAQKSIWEFSNNGTDYQTLGSSNATGVNGPGSTSDAVDLDTSEVAGILPLSKGGTGSSTVAGVQQNFGIRPGIDVQVFTKNNLEATRSPVATDDSTAGFTPGSIWIHKSQRKVFAAVEVSSGAAVWRSLSEVEIGSLPDGIIDTAQLAESAVTSSKIADESITSLDLGPNSCGPTEISTGAVGSTQLSGTGVVAGTYSAATISVDEDGRIVTASSSTETGDISAVGDVLSGPAFVDGTQAGSELVYEGATVDTNETHLTFSGDPSSDATVTIPNTSGTLVTTGDTATVTGTMIGNETVTSSNLAANSVSNSELANDSVTSTKIAADAVGASELASTTVTAGVYNLASITIDADGRITAASSNAEAGDISAVGDVTSGPAFVDGTSSGIEFVYEGATVDSNETRLTFLGDPVSDSTVTIPNTSGTLVTTGDSGTVTGTMIGSDTVTASNIAADGVSSSELATDSVGTAEIVADAITSSEIAPDAVGSSELSATTVTAGTYNLASVTVDSDGRITAASSNSEAGDISAVGDVASGPAFVDGTNAGTEIVYEGSTVDTNETRLTFAGDPASDTTVTIPNRTGTLVTTGDTATVTGTMIDAETVTASNIAADAVASSELATDSVGTAEVIADAITALEIANDAVGSSELAATSVTAGTYNFASITVDADGRITAASSNSESGDISAVGDVMSGPAFVDGINSGTEFVYEGSTVDTNETRLTFSGDPASDTTVTIPNRTGTLVTTGDTATVTGTMIDTDTVTASNIAPDAVTSSELANDSVGTAEVVADAISSSEIAPDAVGSSELSATTVTAGTYNFASVTVDADGRITAASSNSEAGDISAVGDVTSGPAFVDGTNAGTELVYEGSTVDTNETRLTFAGDPASDSTVTVPNRTGTLITNGDTATVTGTMIDAETVTASNIAAEAITSSELAIDSVGAAEIAVDAVGSSELAATSVTAGTYNFASVTVDADGRITSASSNSESGDISAVGDVASGPAFVDGTNAGTELVYEGTTIDTNETRLTFAGDPALDSTVTIPNTSGTLITTGDSATVSGAMIGSNTVTASNIAADAVTSSELASDSVGSAEITADAVGASEVIADAITSSEIAADAVGPSELAATSVTAGTYNFASVTVDADGRITAASSNSEAGDISAVGDVTSGPAFVDGNNAGTELVYEGSTVDANETRLTFAGDPASDITVTIPNRTGTLVTTGDAATVTGTMIDADTVTTSNIAPDAVTSSELATDSVGTAEVVADAITSSEIAPDAIGSSELAATSVTAGTYNFASVTVDADGRITAASSNSEAGDISAVGDVTSGPAFVDGTNAGTELVYEGTTVDTNETRLTFAGDPALDSTVTIPNTSGTLVTTGDSATVSGTMISGDTVTASNIAADAVTSSELASDSVGSAEIITDAVGASEVIADAITSSEIAPDAVGSSELAATTVTAGTYNFASVTVDADGRITSASSNSEAGDISAVGDVASGPAFVDGTNAGTELVYEGSTVDTNETRLTFVGDPASDTTVTIPNRTGTLVTTGDTGTVTGTMIDADTVTASNIAADTVTSSELATDSVGTAEVVADAITASEIAADAVGSSELAATSVTAGTYNFASVTVDADGRITSASSNSETGDISAVGDVASGPAFVDGNNAGTELVYEGTTVDTNETRLAFAGDPASDTTVTIPNRTGTLVTTGDTATVTGTMIDTDTVTASNIAPDAVTSSELATDSVTAAELAADSVGPSELAATSVTAGTYNFASVTVDADGRITLASSNTETGDISAVGDVASGPAFVDGTNAGIELVYEGSTVDTNETRLTFAGDPASDITVTIPNRTGTLVTTGDTATVTGTMIDADTVTNSNLAPDAVTSSELATDSVGTAEVVADAITSSEIAPDAVGSSELAATSVTAGTYNFASVTVDADGRITSASSNSETGDISAIGDVSSGPAFVDGTNAGTEFVYEGSTIDTNETRLTFAGDPASDSIVTVPNRTGTLVTTGDTASVTGTMIDADTVFASNIAPDAVTSSELATDSVAAAELAADSVGSSELAATSVTAGTYNFASVTVDADGRITSASSNSETGDISAVGDVASGPAFIDGTNSGTELVYEGTTVDTNETRLAFAGDPASDTTVTIPNRTGTLVTTGDTATVTGTMIDADSVTASNIAADAITSSELAADSVGTSEVVADAITSSEIAVDAVGTSELAATAVTAGTYSFATVTVDADGRITSASSNAETGDISAVGDVTTGPAFVDGTNSGTELVFEGSTIDANETRLTFAGNPASDSTVTIPNTTGTLVTNNDTGTVSSIVILDSTIANADISSTAAIAYSKLATLATGQILVGNANVPTATTLSGDATIGATGTLTIADNSIDGTDIAVGSDAQGDIMYYNGTDWARLAAGTSGNLLQTNGAGANPTWVAPATGDITSVGNGLTGAVFADGDTVSSQLIYEGSTSDTFETTLAFSTNPTADTTVTIPNRTGTLVTNNDTGTVSSTVILDATIANADISTTAAIAYSKLATLATGQILVGNANVPTATTLSGDATIGATGVLTIASSAIGSSEITDATIANADISTTAAIAYSKLATLATGQILVGNANVPTATALSGDATIGATGVLTIASNAIGSAEITDATIANADISTTAAIAYSKLATLATGQILDATIGATGVLTIASNAIGSAEITDATIANADISSTAAIAYSKLATLATGQIVVGNANVPTATTLSGDATIGATGTLTIADNSVDGSDIAVTSEATGDLMVFNGTDWTRLASATSGLVLTGNGTGVAPSWQSPSTLSGTVLEHPVLSRRFGYAFPPITTSNTFTAIGMNAPTTPTGTASAQAALAGAARMYIQYVSGAVSGNTGGLSGGAFTFTRPAYRPKLVAIVRTDATITSQRIHVGIAESSLAAIVTNTTGSTASTNDFVSVAYDTNGTGNTTDWLCCSGSGTNYSCLTTGVAVAASTEYSISVDWTTGGNLVCTVNGTSVSKGTDLSTAAVNIGPYIALTTNTAATRQFAIAKYSLEQN